MQLASLSLFPATREQTIESRKRTADIWKKDLTVNEYILRDETMDSHEHAAGGRLTTWVLAPRDDPTTLDFMCSCETMHRTGVVANSQGLTEVSCFGIASVYTPPDKGGRGYAGHMMRLLHWALAPRAALPAEFPAVWGPPPDVPSVPGAGTGRFSALYSDIGEDFYRACGPTDQPGQGWLVRGVMQTFRLLPRFDLDNGSTPAASSDGDWGWLTEDNAKIVWECDAEQMKTDVVNRATVTGRTVFSFLPNAGVGAFTVQRTMRFKDGAVPVLPTNVWGVALLPGGCSDVQEALSRESKEPLTYATWTLDVRLPPHTLVVTRLRATRKTLPGLLQRIVEAGKRNGVERLEIWGLAADLQDVAGEHGWASENRVEHLSAFKWYGTDPEEQLEWLFNEKFSWC
ncbi:hypothetical protein OBBRIDRAFT_328171 [Obba rivulosa]|uniref:LYC1 C-terminal domain-containing protein n=1 Tax=Obba rivulosa TaxID=1052685 RepID=A0A8E2J2J6_9APHY|nr:hypothetical protein OBBRIDRAFT_328171 [Obba rivulosa]